MHLTDRIAIRLEVSASVRVVAGGVAHTIQDRRAALMAAMLAVEGSAWVGRLARQLAPRSAEADARLVLQITRLRLREQCGVELIDGIELLRLHSHVDTSIGPTTAELDRADSGAPIPALLAAYSIDDLPEFTQWLAPVRIRFAPPARALLPMPTPR